MHKLAFIAGLVLASLGLGALAWVAAPPASASVAACNVFIPSSCPPRPPATAYGAPLADFPTTAPATWAAGGGWWTTTTASNTVGRPGSIWNNLGSAEIAEWAVRQHQNRIVYLSDPYFTTSGSTLNMRFFSIDMPDYRADSAIDNWFTQASGTTQSTITCATSQWSLPAAQTVYAWGSNGLSVFAAGGHTNQGQKATVTMAGKTSMSSNCLFVVKIKQCFNGYESSVNTPPEVQKLNGGRFPNTAPVPANSSWCVEWNAADWSAGTAYKRTDQSGDLTACLAYTNEPSSECPFVPGYVDKLDDLNMAANACYGAPNPAWLDFSWLIPFVQHYARCLFVPTGTLDIDTISEAVEENGWIEIHQDFITTLDALNWEEGCGVIFNTPPPVAATMNTCSWTWASPIKAWINIIGLMFLGIWAVRKIINTTAEALKAGTFDDMAK